ncbi:ABC transporter substrate-binding protein [Tistrella mobilis]|uniref:ABC transporter permease n=1 Tax=Tistrella mobilis TaxID=171437 RepID=A0A162KBW9_9PROT|nr:ABC transporter substrate-binding protein [Tistrella mobilis]KYO50891.1 ABC transporter permease [Tistrella mobilis]
MRNKSKAAGGRLAVVLAVVAGLMAVAGQAAADEMKPIRIGVLTDLGGVTADATGKGSVEAARLAVEDIGGKVAGRPVEVISADHQHKTDLGSSIAREWFDQAGVDVIVDVPNSAVALAVQEIAREKKKMVLFSGAGTPALTGKSCSPYGVHWTYDTYALSRGTAGAVVKAGGDSWFMIASDYAFGHQLARDAAAVVTGAGGQVVGEVFHPLATADFSSYLLQAQASGAKVVGIANAGGDTINTIKQAGEFGLVAGGQKLAALILMLSDIHGLGLQAAQGTYLTTPSYWDVDDRARALSKRYMERVGAMPGMLQAGVYGEVLHYLKAVDAVGGTDADAVSAKMRALPIDDPYSRNARLREDGRVVRDMYLARVKAPAESKGPWDYLDIVATIPGDELVWPLSESTCPLVAK